MNTFPLHLSALAHKSLADVTRRKLRTLLVVLGIAIGVLGLTAINVANDIMSESISYSANQHTSPDISFSVTAIDPSLVPTLEAVPNVKTVQTSTQFFTRWRTPSGHITMGITGYNDLQQVKLNTFQLLSGHLPGADEIAMESSDRGLQNFALGDTVTIETQQRVQQLHVVGLVRTLGLPSASFISFATGYMNADALGRVSGVTSANTIEVQVQNTNQADATARALADVLNTHHVTVLNVSRSTNNFAQIQTLSNATFTLMRVLSLIALLLASFLIINTVSTLVAEQTKIIGTMKAIGGVRRKILRSYLLSVGIYGILGTIIGLALGIFVGYQILLYLGNLFTLDLGAFTLTPATFLVGAAVGVGIPLLAAILPLWTGTRITVREAMSAYGISNGSRKRRRAGSNTPRMGLTWIPQTTWLGIRGIFRKRGRAALTLLALTLAGTSFLAIQTTTTSFDQFLNQIFVTYHTDALVFTKPTSYDSLRSLMSSVPNVARVERYESISVKTTGGTFDLTGVEANPQEYTYHLLAGRWFRGDEQNVLVISDVMASKLHVKVGDRLTFSSAINTVTWKIIGEASDQSSALAGGIGLTTIDDLHAFEGMPANMAQGFMLQAHDSSVGAVAKMANELDDKLSHAGLSPQIETKQEIIKANQVQFQVLSAILYSVAIIVGLVGILGLFNTLTISVLERRREIGILRSMGATGREVARVFWTEGMALSIIAWGVAALISIPAAYGFVSLISTVLVPIPFAFAPSALVMMLLLIVVIATLASVGPALSAARVRVSSTLRYE